MRLMAMPVTICTMPSAIRADRDRRQIVERVEELRQREDRAGADDGDELGEEVAEKSARQRTHDERADAAESKQAEQLSARALGPVLLLMMTEASSSVSRNPYPPS